MLRLLHLSDVHLGAPFDDFGRHGESRRQELLDAFRGLVQVADSNDVHAVLVAGDLFDSPTPTDYTLSVVRQTLRRLVDAGRPVFVIPGNHDAITCNPDLYGEPFGGAVVFTNPVFRSPASVETEGGPLHVYGLAYDWARPDPLDTFRKLDAPGTHVALLHGCLPGMPHWRWYPNALRISPEWLGEVPVDYVALGGAHDLHMPDRIESAGGRACYPGSFAGVTLDEAGPRGWVVVEIEAGATPRVTHHASPVRPAFDAGTLEVDGLVDESALADAIAERVPEGAVPVVSLTGELSFPLHPDRMDSELQKRFGAGAIRDETWYAASGRLDEVAEQDTIAGHVVRLGRVRLDEARRSADDAAPDLAERAMRLALRSLRVER